MNGNIELVKAMIELAQDEKTADDIITKEFNFKTTQEKLACLRGMFDVEIIGATDDKNTSEAQKIETDYFVALSAVIGSKWRA